MNEMDKMTKIVDEKLKEECKKMKKEIIENIKKGSTFAENMRSHVTFDLTRSSPEFNEQHDNMNMINNNGQTENTTKFHANLKPAKNNKN